MIPKVSYLLTVYNGESYIRHTIESVLNQSFQDFEIVIVDDGSTDNTIEIIKQYIDKRIFIFKQINCGVAQALNVGLNNCKGEFIARLDQDDICLFNRTELQLQYLNKNPHISVLSGSVIYINEDGIKIGRSYPVTSEYAIKKYLFNYGCVISHPCVMMRRLDLINIGGYSEDIGSRFTDYHLWVKFLRKGYRIKNLSTPLIKYRIRNNSISSSFILTNEAFDILKDLLLQDKPEFDKVQELNSICINKPIDFTTRSANLDNISNKIILFKIILGEKFIARLVILLKNLYSFIK